MFSFKQGHGSMRASAPGPTAGPDFGREKSAGRSSGTEPHLSSARRAVSTAKRLGEKGLVPQQNLGEAATALCRCCQLFPTLWRVFFTFFTSSQVVPSRSPGLEGRLQMRRFAAASAGLAADTPKLQRRVCCWRAAY